MAKSANSSMIVCFGEMLIDFVPDVSGVSLAESQGFVKAPGGAPANVACAINNLGSTSAFIGKKFEDLFLDEISNGLPRSRGTEHQIDFIPGSTIPNRLAYRANLEET